MVKIFENPAENKAYMQGFVAGKRADGEDWVRERLAHDEAKRETRKAWGEMQMIADAAQAEIQRLKDENARLWSKLLAYQVAMQSLVNEDLAGRRV